MSDYLISVVDATSAFPTPKENREYQTSNLDDAYDKGWDDCQSYIYTLPPIDAIPVVRCKECRHYAGDGKRCAWDICAFDNFYCYYGEREEE